MTTTTAPARWQIREAESVNRCRPKRPSFPIHLLMARLKEDCADLLTMAEKLERLTADLHRSQRAREAQMLADVLDTGLTRHLDAEVAMLRAVATPDAELLDDTVERTRAEHLALRELVIPVIRGLGTIARNRLPTRLNHFVLETTVLCEFIRLHVNFKCKTLYPLIATLEERRRVEAQ